MFSHVMIGTNDIEKSKRFYDAVLATLGAGEPFRNRTPSGHTRLFYRHEGSSFCVSEPIDGAAATCANGGTIGFKCASPEQVQAFHDAAVAPRRRLDRRAAGPARQRFRSAVPGLCAGPGREQAVCAPPRQIMIAVSRCLPGPRRLSRADRGTASQGDKRPGAFFGRPLLSS